MNWRDLETPCPIVDLDRVEANIAKLQAYLAEHRIANRPHIKTHKVPELARRQLKAGAVGITCQKLGEAEIMADEGLTDIFLPYNLLGAAKLDRLVALARRTKLAVTADSAVTVAGLSDAMAKAGLTLPVLVEFETGAKRCGVVSPAEALDLARTIDRSPGLTFGGLMAYPHNDATDVFVDEAHALFAKAGLAPGAVSLGSTAGMWSAHRRHGVTEYRAGMYVYGDRYSVANGAMTQADCALTVLATVVSRPAADRGVLDAGSKALSSDLLGQVGHGLIVEYPQAVIASLSEEHGHVDFSACDRRPAIGETVTILPNHVCPVSNLFNDVAAVRGERVEAIWEVAARGAVR